MKSRTISFILNNKLITEELNPSLPVLDYIRKKKNLTGTKEVCKEGDCSACTILLGTYQDYKLVYKTITSCIYPLANCNGKHVVTIEGINKKELLLQQQTFVDEHASQCGFCTPGFIMSVTCYFLNNKEYKIDEAINAVAGNICRCTGYHSIIRAMETTIDELRNGNSKNHLEYLVNKNILPEYFLEIHKRMQQLKVPKNETVKKSNLFIGGGSDLFVQRADSLLEEEAEYIDDFDLSYIYEKENKLVIGSGTTFEMIKQSELFQKYFPSVKRDVDLIASLPVRNSATIGGNLTNASPIGDLTIILLALNAELILSDGKKDKILPLSEYYLDYKKLNKEENQYIKEVIFKIPQSKFYFSFEKVSKRTYLDIASVNTALLVETVGDKVVSANLSAGGIAPIPKLLKATSEFLRDIKISKDKLVKILSIAQNEISPITDVRGSAEYKRLLLNQLIKSHFIKLFPEIIKEGEVI